MPPSTPRPEKSFASNFSFRFTGGISVGILSGGMIVWKPCGGGLLDTITSGGVSVREVDPKTMQSKKALGLYFAGEVLDVDAYTGGYNLQIAFCTAQSFANNL